MEGTPRCLNCYYILTGLPSGRCPECGSTFDWADPNTFTTRLPFVWWKFWLPGFLLSFGVGLALYIVVMRAAGWGWAATLVVPFSIGALFAYACRVQVPKALQAALAIILLVLLVLMLAAGGSVGVLCALVLIAVALGPICIGLFAGSILRRMLRQSKSFSQRDYLPPLLLILLPLIWAAIEGQHARHYAVETVTSVAIFEVPPDMAWDRAMFYEDVKISPPLLLRLGLSRPLHAHGPSRHVGDVKVCVYSKGQLAKRITASDPGKLLAFDVIRQWQIEDHDVRLTRGSFQFEPTDDGRTRVTLTTEYEPYLGPRWIWRPFERLAVHTLHEHVLLGMSMNVDAHANPDDERDRNAGVSNGARQ